MTRLLKKNEVIEIAKNMISEGNLKIAIAFWGKGAAKELGLNRYTQNIKIICNLKMGGTNPYEIENIRNSGIDIKQYDTLHSKYYLSNKAAIIGSSNASANGLSFQNTEISGWHESNVFVDDEQVLCDLNEDFDKLWQSSYTISDEDIAKAQELWTKRRSTFLSYLNEIDALEAVLDRPVFVAIYHEKSSILADDTLKNHKEKLISENGFSEKVNFFEGWDELPTHADIISFRIGERGGVYYENTWYMPAKRQLIEIQGSQHKLNICDLSDVKISQQIIDFLKEKIKEADYLENNEYGTCVHVSKFHPHYFDKNIDEKALP